MQETVSPFHPLPLSPSPTAWQIVYEECCWLKQTGDSFMFGQRAVKLCAV